MKLKSKYVTRGSTIATLVLLLSTSIYSYYVNNIASYELYANLASIIILIFLVYIISYTIVLGMAINQTDYMEETANIKK